MGKLSGGKSKQTSTQTQSGSQSGTTGVDAATQAKIDEIYRAAQASGGAMPSGVTQGMDALTGNRDAARQFMNPYQDQVIDAINKQYGVGNEMALRTTNDAATRAGAFGGSRHGIAEGTALAENARNRDSQVAGLLGQGFEGAMGRAGQAVNFGMAGAGSPEAWRLQQLRQGFSGMPYGTTSDQNYRGNADTSTTGAGWNVGGWSR